jgi:hypothetical protein
MTITALSIKEIKQALKDGETLYVENVSPHQVNCNASNRDGLRFGLGPKDSDDSVKVLPEEALNFGGFQRLIMKGHLIVSADPMMGDKIFDQATAKSSADEQRLADLQAVIDKPSNERNLIERRCLISDERVFQSEKDVREGVPPLAERFKDRAHEFIPTEVIEDGKSVFKFTKLT